MSASIYLQDLIQEHAWCDVPEEIISREGKKVDTSKETWHLPYVTRQHASLDFSRIIRSDFRWATKRYISERIQTTSTHAGYSSFQDVMREFFRYQQEFELLEDLDNVQAKQNLIELIEHGLSRSRSEHRLWALYRPIQWYVWCAEHYPELGFCPAYAMELDSTTIPGNPKGEAVRMEDPDTGPLHRTLELPLLLAAMKRDDSTEFEHLQQKAAVALSIALGRNPANLTYLKCKDMVNLVPESDEPCYVINVPRIKKRQLNPRDDLLQEYLDPEFAKYILQLIDANKDIRTAISIGGKSIEIEKPLFIKPIMNRTAIASGMVEDTFNMCSEDISELLKNFVQRHKIISPITNELLHISTRRLRYTLATCLASEGISKAELARILDHTDTQHVLVYFEIAGNIIEHLDKAMAKGFAKYLRYFKGNIIESDEDAINGAREDKRLSFVNEENPTEQTEIGVCGKQSICHLDPPFSCYLCPKFQPYRHADHEYVLDCLLASREVRIQKYENSRLGIQLDQVIMAVAEVSEQCKQELANA